MPVTRPTAGLFWTSNKQPTTTIGVHMPIVISGFVWAPVNDNLRFVSGIANCCHQTTHCLDRRLPFPRQRFQVGTITGKQFVKLAKTF